MIAADLFEQMDDRILTKYQIETVSRSLKSLYLSWFLHLCSVKVGTIQTLLIVNPPHTLVNMSEKTEIQFPDRLSETSTTLESLSSSYDRSFNFEQWAQQVRPQLLAALNKRGMK